MSSCIVPVALIENIHSHSNADSLEICNVLGWQMCIPKGRYTNGQKVVYFPADTVIPSEWAEKWGVTKYLKNGTRVSKVQLRGEPSFGLAVSLPDGQDWAVGENVAEFFGATKYEPPVRLSCGNAESPHPLFFKYTDIENMRNFPSVFQEGELVVATEKIHGSCVRLSCIEGVFMAGSKEIQRKRPETENDLKTNTYWYPFSIPAVKKMLEELGKLHKQVILYGEVYGSSIQNLDYGFKKGKLGFRAFDLLIDGNYVHYHTFKQLCEKYSVEMVPLVYDGPFSLNKMKEISSGNTLLGADHIREGIVCKPVMERTDPKLGRVILKYISDAYLFKKDITDYKDV